MIVIGPGALGAMLGAALQQRGYLVAFLGQNGPFSWACSLAHGQQAGLAPGTMHYQFPAPGPDFYRAAELVLVAVKAFDLERALRHSDLLPPAAPVVALGNGSVEEIVRAHAATRPQRTFRLGLVTVGISQGTMHPSGSHYEVRSTAGKISFGAFVGPQVYATACEARLTAADAIFHWEPDALSAHRRKWLFNTVINSLCAAHRLPCNGELLSRQAEVDAVFREAYDLGETRWGPWRWTLPDLRAGLYALIDSTRANENSMARDRRLGVPTESAYLAGLADGDPRFPRLNALHAAIIADSARL